MPTISDYTELDMTGLNVDHVAPRRSILSANYGDGYKDTARVGALGGTRRFVVSAGVWPDDASIATIAGKSWKKYYSDFIDERLDNANEPFIIEHEGRKWLVDIEGDGYGYEVHTSDLFTPDGITLNLRRVKGLTHASDGSLFDPSLIVDSMWARYKDAQNFPTNVPGVGNAWEDSLEGDIAKALAVGSTDVVSAADVLGTHDAVRFSNTTNNGVLVATGTSVTIYEAFFVMRMREATFSNTCGILTGDTGANNIALAGQLGSTRFFNLSLGSANYRYKKNNVEFAEANQQAPMNVFGVVHIRFPNGRPITNLQVGKDRADASRHAEADIIEIDICHQPLDDRDSEAFNRFLMTFYGIS